MISTASNDLFRKNLPLIWIQILVALVTILLIVIALRVFVAAPVGSLIFLALAVGVRAGVMWVYCKATGKHFDVFERKVPPPVVFDGGIKEEHAQLPGSYLDDHVLSPVSYLDEETSPQAT
ncbi:hypothetical protein RUND412_008837 [Rhizina undulata]